MATNQLRQHDGPDGSAKRAAAPEGDREKRGIRDSDSIFKI
jgi:hypothetical protein